MKKPIFLLAFLSSTFFINAQTRDTIVFLMQQYDYQSAIQEINAIHPDSLDAEILYLKATALKALSRYREAIPCLEEIYQADSSDLKIALELADCYKSAADFKKPQEIYEKSLALHPGNSYIMQLTAGACMTNGLYNKALLYYADACKDDTTSFLLKQLATCYEKTGMPDSAIIFNEKAIQIDPDDYLPVFHLATLYKNMDLYEEGILVTDNYLSGHPDNLDINRLNGYLQYLVRDFSKAAERFQKCADLKDTSAFLNKYLGYSYFRLNKYDKTMEYLGKALGTNNSDAEMYYVMGLCYDVPVNISYFDTTIRLVSPAVNFLSEVYQYMALALTKTAAYDSALVMLLKAYQLTPNDITLLNKIGTHYDNWMENKPIALKYYREFLATRSGNIKRHLNTPPDFEHEYNMVEDRIRQIETQMKQPAVMPDSTLFTPIAP